MEEKIMNKVWVSAFTSTVFLAACATITGNYEINAVDAEGRQLNKMVFTATGSGIYTARNALCQSYPKSRIIIVDLQTRQELAGESPYQCR